MISIHESYQIMQLSWWGGMISQTFKWGMWYLFSPPWGNPTVTFFYLVPQYKRVNMTTVMLLLLQLQWSLTWTKIEILEINDQVEALM